jgi:hypothetical protein
MTKEKMSQALRDAKAATKGTTHYEYVDPYYYVCIQHCETCGDYLGVNYPALYCDECSVTK